jgi:hypothetical protein
VYEPLCSTTGQPNATTPPTPDGPGDCTPRPLDGVAVTVKSEGGTTVAAVTTDDIGRAVLRIDPGSYVVTGGPAGGPTITPQPLQVVVTAPGTTVTLHYQSNLE